MKVAINTCYGGFSLSEEAIEYIWNKHHKMLNSHIGYEPKDRTDPAVIDAIETLGEKADGAFAELKIVEVPDDVKWHIDEYDGNETIHENHRVWR